MYYIISRYGRSLQDTQVKLFHIWVAIDLITSTSLFRYFTVMLFFYLTTLLLRYIATSVHRYFGTSLLRHFGCSADSCHYIPYFEGKQVKLVHIVSIETSHGQKQLKLIYTSSLGALLERKQVKLVHIRSLDTLHGRD